MGWSNDEVGGGATIAAAHVPPLRTQSRRVRQAKLVNNALHDGRQPTSSERTHPGFGAVAEQSVDSEHAFVQASFTTAHAASLTHSGSDVYAAQLDTHDETDGTHIPLFRAQPYGVVDRCAAGTHRPFMNRQLELTQVATVKANEHVSAATDTAEGVHDPAFVIEQSGRERHANLVSEVQDRWQTPFHITQVVADMQAEGAVQPFEQIPPCVQHAASL